MKKIFSAEQMTSLDKKTIELQGISSDRLMERAAYAFVEALDLQKLLHHDITIIAGVGNNGGDALAVSRIFLDKGIKNKLVFCQYSPRIAPDCQLNLNRLKQYQAADIQLLLENQDLPSFSGIVIDGLFGSGLNRPVTGYWSKLIEKINEEADRIISIDIPSGFFTDRLTNSSHIHRAEVITFDSPKLSFLMPESQYAIDSFKVVDIGLDNSVKTEMESDYYYISQDAISSLVSKRKKFTHKGSYGKVCIVGGTDHMIGGVTLAGRAALSSGCGYVFYEVPFNKWEATLNQHPEGIVNKRTWVYSMNALNTMKLHDQYVYGIGPAMGDSDKTQKAILKFLKDYQSPVVLDADALNMISKVGLGIAHLSPQSILTPHQKEFERLIGNSSDSFDQLSKLRQSAMVHQLFLCLKGPHTIMACPDGRCYFNSTGNPGMAVAGSGDVLTGMICSFLAQRKNSKEAALLGIYLHGFAGNLAAAKKGEYGMTANDIIQNIPEAISQHVC